MINSFRLFEREVLFPKRFVYWKLSTKRPDFLIQLWKIGMSDAMIKSFDRVFDKDSDRDVYIYYKGEDTPENMEHLNWTWKDIGKRDKIIGQALYKYIGQVYLTDQDLEDYEVDQMAKKYNI